MCRDPEYGFYVGKRLAGAGVIDLIKFGWFRSHSGTVTRVDGPNLVGLGILDPEFCI